MNTEMIDQYAMISMNLYGVFSSADLCMLIQNYEHVYFSAADIEKHLEEHIAKNSILQKLGILFYNHLFFQENDVNEFYRRIEDIPVFYPPIEELHKYESISYFEKTKQVEQLTLFIKKKLHIKSKHLLNDIIIYLQMYVKNQYDIMSMLLQAEELIEDKISEGILKPLTASDKDQFFYLMTELSHHSRIFNYRGAKYIEIDHELYDIITLTESLKELQNTQKKYEKLSLQELFSYVHRFQLLIHEEDILQYYQELKDSEAVITKIMDLYPEECDQIEKDSGLDYGTIIVLLVQKTLAKHYNVHQLPDIHFICSQAQDFVIENLKVKDYHIVLSFFKRTTRAGQLQKQNCLSDFIRPTLFLLDEFLNSCLDQLVDRKVSKKTIDDFYQAIDDFSKQFYKDKELIYYLKKDILEWYAHYGYTDTVQQLQKQLNKEYPGHTIELYLAILYGLLMYKNKRVFREVYLESKKYMALNPYEQEAKESIEELYHDSI